MYKEYEDLLALFSKVEGEEDNTHYLKLQAKSWRELIAEVFHIALGGCVLGLILDLCFIVFTCIYGLIKYGYLPVKGLGSVIPDMLYFALGLGALGCFFPVLMIIPVIFKRKYTITLAASGMIFQKGQETFGYYHKDLKILVLRSPRSRSINSVTIETPSGYTKIRIGPQEHVYFNRIVFYLSQYITQYIKYQDGYDLPAHKEGFRQAVKKKMTEGDSEKSMDTIRQEIEEEFGFPVTLAVITHNLASKGRRL